MAKYTRERESVRQRTGNKICRILLLIIFSDYFAISLYWSLKQSFSWSVCPYSAHNFIMILAETDAVSQHPSLCYFRSALTTTLSWNGPGDIPCVVSDRICKITEKYHPLDLNITKCHIVTHKSFLQNIFSFAHQICFQLNYQEKILSKDFVLYSQFSSLRNLFYKILNNFSRKLSKRFHTNNTILITILT